MSIQIPAGAAHADNALLAQIQSNGGSLPWQHLIDEVRAGGEPISDMDVLGADFEAPITNVQLVDEVLTRLVVGTPQIATMPGAVMLPEFGVSQWSFRYPTFGVERLVEHDAKRAMRAQIKTSDFTTGSASDELVRYSWGVPRDFDELSNDQQGLGTQMKAASMARSIVELSMEIDRAELLTTVTNYPASHRLAIGAGSEWDDATPGNALTDIQSMRDAICDDIGCLPDEITMFLSAESYRAILTQAAFLTFKKDVAGSSGDYRTGLDRNLDALKQWLEIGRVWIGNPRKADNTGTMGSVYGDVAILYYDGALSAQPWDNSHGEYVWGRTFKWNRGLASRPYTIPDRTTVVYPWHDYMKAKIQNSSLAAIITNTAA